MGEHRASGAGADDAEVDLVLVAVPTHGVLTGEVTTVHVEEEARVVVGRSHRTLEQRPQAHVRVVSVTRTGSSAVAPRASNGSRTASGPRRM